jgi:hypothetical protein
MPIPNPSLDDVTFEQLVEEAKKNISRFSKFWTNYNLSDPGITLLELFAWLTENQIYSLNKITKKNYLKFLKLLGVRPLEADAPKIDLTIFMKHYSGNKNDNGNSFYLPKRSPFIVKQKEVFVESEEGIWIIPSLQIKRCVIYSQNQYSDVKLVNPTSVADSIFSSISNTSSLSAEAKSIKSWDSNSHSSTNSEPFFFLFGDDPNDNDHFYLKMEFATKDVKRGHDISLSFYLYEKDLPPIGQHGFERPEDFIDKDFQSQLLWEYADYEVVRNNPHSNSYDIDGKKDKAGQAEGGESDNSHDTSNERKIVWSPLKIEDTTLSFSKSGKITFQYPTDKTREKFDLFSDLPTTSTSEDEVSSGEARENQVQNANDKGELWVRCRIIKQNFHFIPPRIECILPNTVSCSFGYTIEQKLNNKSPIEYRPTSDNDTLQNSKSDKFFGQYRGLSNGLSNQIFDIDSNSRFSIIKLNYLKVNNEKWERVDDLISSHPEDKHYVILEEKKGLVRFGDGENGKVPPKGSKIEIKYKFGNMQYWWIEPGKHFIIDEHQLEQNSSNSTTALSHRLVATNFFPSSIGRKAETIGEAIIRARQELVVPFKAVSKSDCEYIAKNTPGLRVGKVKATTSKNPGEENTLIIAAIPYSLPSSAKRLDSNQEFRDAIRRHLEKHKLITTSIQVIDPKYVGISLITRIKLVMKNLEQTNIIKKRIVKSLDSHFSPLSDDKPVIGDGGWDFGTNVYRSKIIALLESLPGVETVLELRLEAFGDNGFHTDTDGNIIMEELNLVYLRDISVSFI